MEQSPIYNQMNLAYYYNDQRWPKNQLATKNEISTYICPSDPLAGEKDPFGYGRLDYFATVYTDIDPVTGVRNKLTTKLGALGFSATQVAGFSGRLTQPKLANVSDGTTSTIMFIEDSGRTFETQGYNTRSDKNDPACNGWMGAVGDGCPSGNLRAVHRWADPDAAGSGVSGPPNAVVGATKGYINQNRIPNGGPADCPWGTNNCGLNDEPFSFHTGGVNATMSDGSVQFFSDSIDGIVLRYLVTRDEGVTVPGDVISQ